MCLILVASAVDGACQSCQVDQVSGRLVQHTLESLLCGCSISASAEEVVTGTDGQDTTTDLDSSGHVDVMLFVLV
jgi:hypothetical protein